MVTFCCWISSSSLELSLLDDEDSEVDEELSPLLEKRMCFDWPPFK
jgi:hypothetical protein